MKWERGFFTIAPRPGHTAADWEGLIEETHTFAIILRDRVIEITHVPSGKRLASCTSLASADRMVEQLLCLPTDWSRKDVPLTEVEAILIHNLVQRI